MQIYLTVTKGNRSLWQDQQNILDSIYRQHKDDSR